MLFPTNAFHASHPEEYRWSQETSRGSKGFCGVLEVGRGPAGPGVSRLLLWVLRGFGGPAGLGDRRGTWDSSHFLNIPINIREANYNTWSFKFDNFSEFQNVISNRSPASLPPTPEHYYDPQSTKINIWLTPNHKDIILNRRNNW